jgi:hypothetical protein
MFVLVSVQLGELNERAQTVATPQAAMATRSPNGPARESSPP